jgi:uncharacterized YccA/Bax inhibitor family protein
MFNNYPSAYLLLLSSAIFLGIYLIAPIVGSWHLFCSIAVDVLKFSGTIVCIFFLLCAVIEAAHNLFLKNRHH